MPLEQFYAFEGEIGRLVSLEHPLSNQLRPVVQYGAVDAEPSMIQPHLRLPVIGGFADGFSSLIEQVVRFGQEGQIQIAIVH